MVKAMNAYTSTKVRVGPIASASGLALIRPRGRKSPISQLQYNDLFDIRHFKVAMRQIWPESEGRFKQMGSQPPTLEEARLTKGVTVRR